MKKLVLLIVIGMVTCAWAHAGKSRRRDPEPPILEPIITISSAEIDRMLLDFEGEPKVQEVIKHAVDYANATKGEIDSWKSRIRNAPWLPVLRTGVDRKTDLGTSTREQIGGPDVYHVRDRRDWGLDVKLEWNLPHLVFNRDELLIARESVRLAHLRDRVLNEVISHYFERRQLQIELKIHKDIEPMKRINVLVEIQRSKAHLSALTGGWFDDAVKG